jgi:PAS domain S-box-containing protein
VERTLQESAELYQTLFVNAANPAYQIDEGGRYVDANQAGIAFLQTTRQELLQQTVREHIGDSALEALQLATGGGPTRIEVTVEVDSELKTLILTVVPCQVGGQPMYFALGTDVTEDRQLRRALQESEESLRRQAVALEESNTALRVILEQRTRDRDDLARTMLGNVEQMILPMLARLARPLADTPEIIYLDAVGQTLRDVLQPIAQSLDGSLDSCPVPLTPREREIANLKEYGRDRGRPVHLARNGRVSQKEPAPEARLGPRRSAARLTPGAADHKLSPDHRLSRPPRAATVGLVQ